MSLFLSVLGYVLAALVIDWLFVTRIGSYFTEFDYRYWPFSRLRWIGLAALISAAIYMWMMTDTNGPLSTAIPFALLFVSYVVTALADLAAQRRAGYKKPSAPRYSDGKYGS